MTGVFAIMPIGPDDSDVRRRADVVFDCVIRPAVEAVGFDAVRGDLIPRAGDAMAQIKHQLRHAQAVVADITGGNPNVFLELGFCYGVGRRVVLITENEHAPWDIVHERRIRFDHTDVRSVRACVAAVTQQLRTELQWSPIRPVATAPRQAADPIGGTDLQLHIGDRIREQRRQRGWSQEELASRAGLHRTNIGHVERGNRNIDLRTLQRLARVLEVDPGDLLRPASGE